MQVTVSTHQAGVVWVADAREDLLTACCFKAAEETEEELAQRG